MRLIIITQDDPFYLGKHIDYLFKNMPSWVKISGVVLLDPSPFGKHSLFEKSKRTYRAFGFIFFVRYAYKYIITKFINQKFLIRNVIKKFKIRQINLPNQNINNTDCLNLFSSLNPDLIISIQANQIFKKKLLNVPKYGILNLHTAKLPKYRGVMPSFWALKNNEKEIGVSVFFMDEGIDSGEIIVQKIISLNSIDTLESVINRTKKVGMDAIIKAITLIKDGNYETIKQEEKEKSYFSFPTRKDIREFRLAGKKFW